MQYFDSGDESVSYYTSGSASERVELMPAQTKGKNRKLQQTMHALYNLTDNNKSKSAKGSPKGNGGSSWCDSGTGGSLWADSGSETCERFPMKGRSKGCGYGSSSKSSSSKSSTGKEFSARLRAELLEYAHSSSGGSSCADSGSETCERFPGKGWVSGNGAMMNGPNQSASKAYSERSHVAAYSASNSSLSDMPQGQDVPYISSGDESTIFSQSASAADYMYERAMQLKDESCDFQEGMQGLPLEVMDVASYHSSNMSESDIEDFENFSSTPKLPDSAPDNSLAGISLESIDPPQANLDLDFDWHTDDLQATTEEQKHNAGKCKPCLYAYSKVGCRNAEACKFCHLPHQTRTRPRPCKATREQCRKIADMLETHVNDPEQRLKFSELLGARSPYTRLILKGKQRKTSDNDTTSCSDASSEC